MGKGTLIRGLLERMPGLRLSVSATTRAARAGEEHGTDYWFLGHDEFDRRVAEGDFVEHAEYAGNRYGTLRSELEEAPEGIVLEIDVQGARQVRETLPEATQVFIAPPSVEVLRERLEGRGLGLARAGQGPAGRGRRRAGRAGRVQEGDRKRRPGASACRSWSSLAARVFGR